MRQGDPRERRQSSPSELAPETRLWPTQLALSDLVERGTLDLDEALLIMARRDGRAVAR